MKMLHLLLCTHFDETKMSTILSVVMLMTTHCVLLVFHYVYTFLTQPPFHTHNMIMDWYHGHVKICDTIIANFPQTHKHKSNITICWHANCFFFSLTCNTHLEYRIRRKQCNRNIIMYMNIIRLPINYAVNILSLFHSYIAYWNYGITCNMWQY